MGEIFCCSIIQGVSFNYHQKNVRSRISLSDFQVSVSALWQSLGLVSKIDPGLGLGGYGLDYITVQYRDYTTDRLGVMAQKAEDMLLNEDNKWKIVQCATFSKSLNPRNIDKSVSDIRIRIRFPFENNFRISVCGCKPPILPDIQPANRIVIIYAVREMVCFFWCEIKIFFFHEPRIHWKLGPGKSAANFHLTLRVILFYFEQMAVELAVTASNKDAPWCDLLF